MNDAARNSAPGPDTHLDWFRIAATKASDVLGKPWAFAIAVLLMACWGLAGPLFGFSDTWQLIVNTGTTIVTFLMVFLIQNTQNRDSRALHLKLDELIRATAGARTSMADLNALDDDELARLEQAFRRLARYASRRSGSPDDESR